MAQKKYGEHALPILRTRTLLASRFDAAATESARQMSEDPFPFPLPSYRDFYKLNLGKRGKLSRDPFISG